MSFLFWNKSKCFLLNKTGSQLAKMECTMNNTLSSTALKPQAKQLLFGNYANLISALLTIYISDSIIIYLIRDNTSGNSVYLRIITYTANILLIFFTGLFSSGQAKMYLDFCSKRPFNSLTVFSGFKIHPDKAIRLQINICIKGFISFIPLIISYYIYFKTKSAILIPIIIAILILGIVLFTYFILRFSLSFYLMHDFPDYSPKKIVALSNRLMKGYKWKLFILNISFIPLILLGVLSFGFGLLWVLPYYYTTKTNFYLELMRIQTNHSKKTAKTSI